MSEMIFEFDDDDYTKEFGINELQLQIVGQPAKNRKLRRMSFSCYVSPSPTEKFMKGLPEGWQLFKAVMQGRARQSKRDFRIALAPEDVEKIKNI